MRHTITQSEAAAIHQARQLPCSCNYCGRPVKANSSTLDHYCDERREADEAELRAGTR